MAHIETDLAWKIADVASTEIYQWHVLHQLALESFDHEVNVHQCYHDSAIAAANAISALYAELLDNDEEELSSPFLSLIEYDDFVQDDFNNALRAFVKSSAMLRHPSAQSPEKAENYLAEMIYHAHELCKRAHEIVTR